MEPLAKLQSTSTKLEKLISKSGPRKIFYKTILASYIIVSAFYICHTLIHMYIFINIYVQVCWLKSDKVWYTLV